MDDFVVSVRQIGNYPAVTLTGINDLVLLQQNGLGGAYASITAANLVSTALLNATALKLKPSATINWNGAALSFDGSGFAFSNPLSVPSLTATTAISSPAISVGSDPVATEAFVSSSIGELSIVSSFNSRSGDVVLTVGDILRAGGAPIWDAHFGGHITVPTAWNALANDDTAASTAFVQAAICQQLNSGHVVLSYNGRSGNVIPVADDITTALTVPGVYGLANTPPIGDASKRIANTMFVDQSLAFFQTEMQDFFSNVASELDQNFAPIDSPQFTGIPTAPTAAQTVNSGQIATTAFVKAAVTASTTGVASFNTRTGAVVLTTADVTGVGGALLAGPAFTGTPTAPTPAPGDSTTKLATTAFVTAAVAAVAAGVTSFNTRTGAVVLTSADVTGVGGALLASPIFSGTPSAPTPAPTDNTTRLATTQYVTAAIAALPAPVTSFNGRTGAVTFQASDVSAVGGALLASPVFTGAPTAPTALAGNATTQIATTAFVAAAVSAVAAGVTTFNGRSGAVTLAAADITSAGGALLAGPTFTGVPAAPTATAGTNTTQLATTAFVTAAISAAATGVASFNGRTGSVTLQASDVSAVGGALSASPAFTGNPTAPTPSPGDNDTSIATTAFVVQALAGAGGVSSFNSRAGAVVLTAADVAGVNIAVRYDAAQTLTAPQQAQARSNISTPLRGQLAGLTLSTAGSSATFGIAVGEAADSTAAALLQLTSAITKTTAAWAVGSGNGALDTGVIAVSTWYHVHLIKRPDTGVVDVLASLSATTPTLPASYTLFRRLGSMKTNASSQWTAFVQNGDMFLWSSPFGDVTGAALSTSVVNYALSVPFGLNVVALFHGTFTNTAVTLASILFYSPVTAVQAVGTPSGNSSLFNSVVNQLSTADFQILTNASTQIAAICSQAANNQLYIVTTGWIDRRGRDA